MSVTCICCGATIENPKIIGTYVSKVCDACTEKGRKRVEERKSLGITDDGTCPWCGKDIDEKELAHRHDWWEYGDGDEFDDEVECPDCGQTIVLKVCPEVTVEYHISRAKKAGVLDPDDPEDEDGDACPTPRPATSRRG